MILERFVNGRARSNAYLYAPDGRECLIVDAGVGAAAKMDSLIAERSLEPRGVLLTHGHPDHTWTARALSERFGIPVYLHPRDWCWLDDPICGGYVPLVRIGGRLAGRLRPLRPPRLEPLVGDQMIEVAGVPTRVLHTPGHTAGSACFLAGDMCFVGDTLFAGSLGHTGYPGGNRVRLLESIRRTLIGLDDEVRLLPGHGSETTVARERPLFEQAAAAGREMGEGR